MTSGEHSGGSVAMINISNYVKTATVIKDNFTNLGTTLGVSSVQQIEDIQLYPNPATDYVNIVAPQGYHYAFCSITGQILGTGNLRKGDNKINIDNLSAGVYLLKIIDSETSAAITYKIMKQ